MKSFSRNLKAISPIFATLILIAIAVIAGVVVYMFTSGALSSMTNGTTAGQEKVAVQSVDVAGAKVYAQNMGPNDVSITGIIVKDANGNTIGTPYTTAQALAKGGALTPLTFTPPTATGSYTVTLTSANGGSFVSSSFIK